MIARILSYMDPTNNTLNGAQFLARVEASMNDTLQRLFRFKAWADDELLTALGRLDLHKAEALTRRRAQA